MKQSAPAMPRTMPSLTDAYLDQLPNGLASYPECTARLEIFMVLLDRIPKERWDRRFAAAIAPHLTNVRRAWVPEVLCSTITMMLRDHLASDEALQTVAYAESLALYKRPLYRALMMVLSPTLLAMGTARRWGATHQGTELEAVKWEHDGEETTVDLELRHPPGLFQRLHHLAYGEAFRAAADVTRAKSVSVEVASYEEHGEYRVRWIR